MKSLCTCVILLVATTTAMAADDPFVGNYRLNVERSTSSGMEVPTDATVAFSEDGDNLVLTVSAKRADGASLDETTSMPKRGGELRRIDGGVLPYESVTATRPESTTITWVMLQDGSALVVTFELSVNHEVLTRTVSGTNARGQQVAAVFVFDRQ